MQGSFVRKRGNTWTAYYYVPDGATYKRRQRSKGGFATKAAARAFLTTVLNQVQIGEYVEPDKLTFGEYLTQRWLPVMESNLRPSTFDSYGRILRLHVIPNLGGIPLQQLSANDLDQLYTKLLKRGKVNGEGGLSPKTVHYLHTTMHKALKDAVRKNLVIRNVADAADPPKLSPNSKIKSWTPEELRIFLAAIGEHRLNAAYLLTATTGMRRGEILGLKWADVDVSKRRLTIRQTITSVNYKMQFGETKTNHGRRSIAIDETTLAALLAHRRGQDDERLEVGGRYDNQDYVFAKDTGAPIHPDYFSQLFNRTVARLPVRRLSVHGLRHTHATIGLAAGIPSKIMSDRLGHATVAFTEQTYMHVMPGMQEGAADQMAELIFGKPEPGQGG